MSDTDKRAEQPWENTGARFWLEDGREVQKGDVFLASASDPDVIRRRHKLVPAMVGYEITVPPLGEDEELEDNDGDTTDEPPDHPFVGIDFGSDQAYELARDSDPPLTAADFEGRTGEGVDGAFVKSDVQAILDERNQRDG